MKEVIVVGSVNRNSRNVTLRTVMSLITSGYCVWISDGFGIRELNCKLHSIPGTGNVARRLARWDFGRKLLNSRFYVCVLPYHGQETKHELDHLKKLKVVKFMRVFANGTIHDCKLREVLEPVPGCDPLSEYRTELDFSLMEV